MPPRYNNRKDKGRKGGKGRGKGKGRRNPAEFLAPLDFNVNEKKRFDGECVYFNRRSGFGFIKPKQDGVAHNDKVMVFWKEIKSSDRWPYLYKGLEVEFNLARFEKANGKGAIIKATGVSHPKGKEINLQDEAEAKCTYVHSKNTRFTGEVKYYNVAKGAGFVTLDSGYAGVEDVPSELRIVRNEIQSGNEAPVLRNGLKVEFGIQKNERGKYSCYSLSMPGGNNIVRTEVEERKNAGSGTFNGEVKFYDFRKGYGYLAPEALNKFPASIRNLLEESKKNEIERLKKRGQTKKADLVEPLVYFRRGDVSSDTKIFRGNKATFKMYTDNRGAGACDVKIAA